MYGLLFNILRETVIGEYGAHYWKEICVRSGMVEMEGELVAKKLYDEESMTQLLSTTANVLGVEVEPILELCGEQFFRNIKHSGHYKIVSCLGSTLEGFLLNLDTLHDHLALAYPKMKPLCFRAEKSQNGLLLHYFSTRKGLYPMVIGMVKIIAREFYNLSVEITLEEEVVDESSALPYHYKLAIEMTGKKDSQAVGRLRGNSVVPEIISLPPSRTSFNDPVPNIPSPESPVPISTQTAAPPHIHLLRGKEERSQSTGQILRERSGGLTLPLPANLIADLTRLCPASLSDVQEEEEETQEEVRGEDECDALDIDIDRTPIPLRRASPSSESPQSSPIRRRLANLSDGDELGVTTFLRRGSSHSSLVGGLPPSLLPTLTSSTSKVSLTAPRVDSSMSMTTALDSGWPITRSLFQICFPFHLIFDTSLTIHYMGASMSRLLPDAIAREERLTDHFDLLRPIGALTYQTIRRSIHNPFILALKPSPSQENCDRKALQFRGQMVPVINSESCPILFLGSPRIETVEDLQLKGLYLTDFPVHDVTRELILMSHHFKAEVNVAYQLEVTKRELELEKRKVQEEKQRADTLLHAMLPQSVAMKLTTGDSCNQVVAEEVEMVTILFSDIKDFTTICHRCAPMDVVSMLNDLYTKFDSYIDHHKVYKVETIGDAYMVAAGLLDTSPDHAEAVTNMAFDMRQAAEQVTTPHTDESIQIRIGIHTGHVVAGVVGTKMPRYCLFGDTVNTASRMESHGEAGHIHISQMTYKRLRGRPYIFWNRGKIRIKGLPDLQQTYFVEPGEDHELSETMHIRVEVGEDSDSDWEDTQVESNAFVRQKRLPSFVRYKDIRVIAPSPVHSPEISASSIHSDNSSLRLPNFRRRSSAFIPPKRPVSPRPDCTYQPTMKEKLAGKLSLGSIGSFSLSQGLSNFLEHDEGTYREMGIDLPHSQLTVETASEHERKISNCSVGVFIKVEPEGKSVTLTKERISVSSNSPTSTQDEAEEEEDGEREGLNQAGIGSKSEGDLQAAMKAKKHRKRHSNKNKCKVS